MSLKRIQMALISVLWIWLAAGPFSSLHAQDIDIPETPASRLAARAEALLPKQYAVLPTAFMAEVHRRIAIYEKDLPTDVALSDYLFRQYGYKAIPASINSDELGFDSSLLKQVLVSLSFFPKNTFPLRNRVTNAIEIHSMILRTSLVHGYLALTGEQMVRLSQTAFLPEDEEKRIGTLFHEEAHDLDENLDHPSEAVAWQTLSHWVGISEEPAYGAGELNFYSWRLEKMERLSSAGLISKYAADGVREDFAESVTAYCFENAELQKVSPDKYKFIREKIFSKKECNLGSR